MCICMSKSFYEKINLLLFVQYESEHLMFVIYNYNSHVEEFFPLLVFSQFYLFIALVKKI